MLQEANTICDYPKDNQNDVLISVKTWVKQSMEDIIKLRQLKREKSIDVPWYAINSMTDRRYIIKAFYEIEKFLEAQDNEGLIKTLKYFVKNDLDVFILLCEQFELQEFITEDLKSDVKYASIPIFKDIHKTDEAIRLCKTIWMTDEDIKIMVWKICFKINVETFTYYYYWNWNDNESVVYLQYKFGISDILLAHWISIWHKRRKYMRNTWDWNLEGEDIPWNDDYVLMKYAIL